MVRMYFMSLLLIGFLIPCSAQEIKFGVITDIHHGFLTDVNNRMQLFTDAAMAEEVDFIIQLGDFSLAMKDAETSSFLGIWNSFDGPKYHVLGNHDMDRNSKKDVQDYLGMESNYYSFDMHGFHFVILDDNHIKIGNGDFIDYSNGNYFGADRDWFGEEQLDWCVQDLANTDLPTVVFRHAGLHASDREALENIISNANSDAGYNKILLGLSGHGHRDVEEIIDGVPYVEIPTASHKWVSANERAEPYTTARFAFVTINARNGTLVIDGRSEVVEYQQGLPTHEGSITDKFYTFEYHNITSFNDLF